MRRVRHGGRGNEYHRNPRKTVLCRRPPHGAGILIVHHVFRPNTTLQILEVGALLPLHATALGKAVLAYSPHESYADFLDNGLPKLTAKTLASKTALKRDLEATRERGYATEKEEAVIGEAGLAAPILDRRGETIGAIGITGPRERLLRRSRQPALAETVIQAARGISRELGAQRWPA